MSVTAFYHTWFDRYEMSCILKAVNCESKLLFIGKYYFVICSDLLVSSTLSGKVENY